MDCSEDNEPCHICDFRKTVSLCQQAERAGVSWIAVHGRTPDQRSTPVNIEAIRTIKDSVRLPVIANGDIRSLGDAEYIQQQTGVHGAYLQFVRHL